MPRYAVTPDQFRDQMSVLAREGFCSLTLEEFSAAAAGLRDLPERSVLITFDDGYRDSYCLAWPIAREFGMKLNFFICTGLVSGQRIDVFENDTTTEQESRVKFPSLWQSMSWAQLREMNAAGVNLGFHSHSHRNLGLMSPGEITADVNEGLSLFQHHLGIPAKFFAFPFGHFGSYSKVAEEILRGRGMELFFTTELGRTALAKTQRTFSRIVVHPEDDMHSFLRKIYGGYDWIGDIRKLNYAVKASFSRTLIRESTETLSSMNTN